jgi:hypothetical protein
MLLEKFNDEFDDAIEVKIAVELSEQSTKEKKGAVQAHLRLSKH